MERLTKRYETHIAVLCENCPRHHISCYDSADCSAVLRDRLALYEDIGTVEDFKRLVTAQNEGRLVELPCKVGDDIYWINDEENSVSVQKNGIRGILVRKDGFAIEDTDGYIDIVGTKYCYLTREEADTALAKEDTANDK